MRGALSVTVDDRSIRGWLSNDVRTARPVTRHVRDLRFTKTAPGGHHTANMRLILPRDTFRDLGPADRVYVYDARTGRTVWEGYTENPGVKDGAAGQEYELAAMGGSILAADRSEPALYVDRSFEQWTQTNTMAPGATAEASNSPATGDPALLTHYKAGQPVGAGTLAGVLYDMRPLGIEVGAVTVNFHSGLDSNDWVFRFGLEGTWSEDFVVRTVSRTNRTVQALTGPKFARAWMVRTGGATNVATDNVWTAIFELAVRGQSRNRNGARVAGVSPTHVLASEVAEDVLGRLLSVTCDPARSIIETTTAQIDQLAYFDGAKARDILDSLALHEPDFLWEVLESGPNGHRFNFRKWPTAPRYEISVRDGYETTGGEIDLCNRIAVYWADRTGAKRTTVVTADVPELGNRVRDAEPVELPEGHGSSTNAQRIGQQILASKNTPPKASRASVRRPILDHLTGSTVMPWEIEPGYVVRVRETGDDLRLTEMEYADEDCSAALTLGEPTLTTEQLLAGLA